MNAVKRRVHKCVSFPLKTVLLVSVFVRAWVPCRCTHTPLNALLARVHLSPALTSPLPFRAHNKYSGLESHPAQRITEHLLPTIQKMCFWFLRLLYGFHQQGAPGLAGFLIEIYMGFLLVLESESVCVCVGVFGYAYIKLKVFFFLPSRKICGGLVSQPYSPMCLTAVLALNCVLAMVSI